MARVPKHRRIKRATVLIKRTRCVKNIKSKSYTPIYQKLKHNNHSLAMALTQEKQESQSLFTRNIELLSEVQELVQACNSRDLVISNVLKNSKQMMQMLVNMSEFLTNTISSCQEYVSNQQPRRSSGSSAGRRESTKRMSTKSPARGVVKPMVSGHTITRPTINLSRVNMQRLQNVNLSIIEEGPASPDRSLNRSVESRRSRVLPDRMSVPALGSEDGLVLNRRANRYSGARSSRRFSKRNSGRLSSRLSKRSSEPSELIKSPRVALQDVSRYLCNNQTVNVRTFSESARSSNPSRSSSSVEEEQVDEVQSSPENSTNVTNAADALMESCESSESDGEDTLVSEKSRSKAMSNETRSDANRSLSSSSDTADPMEGPSWLYDSIMESPERTEPNRSPVSSILTVERRKSPYFRVPELPKSMKTTRFNLNNTYAASPSTDAPPRNGIVSSFVAENDEDSDDQPVNLRFITRRRGPSSRTPSVNGPTGLIDDDDDDDEDDDETLILNMKRQLKPQAPPRETEFEQPERLQFDMNELLQLTPLKPLLSINAKVNNANSAPTQMDVDNEVTTTVQITQRPPNPLESTPRSTDSVTFGRMTTVKIQQNNQPEMTAHGEDATQDRRMSEITTEKIDSMLPRLPDVLNLTDDHTTQMILTPAINKAVEKRKRIASKQPNESIPAVLPKMEYDDEAPRTKNKKTRERKKKSNDENDQNKDPSSAKVVLQKLTRANSVSDGLRSERKKSDESISSTRSSMLSRADPSSDSEGSTSSYSSKQIPSRPRRQKAPTNLQEPSLSKKLRR